MTLSDWGNIGQVIAAVAVVLSLIFVGLQVRQNTKAVKLRHCSSMLIIG